MKQKERKYFEYMGDTINNNRFLHFVVGVLMICLVFLSIALVNAVRKEPIVIKVDQLGKAESYKASSNQSLSPHEINNFTQHFLGYFLKYHVYTQFENFTKAFGMVTDECAIKLNRYLEENEIEKYIETNQIKTDLNITKLDILDDSPEFIKIKVRGTREETSYLDPAYFKEIIFGDILVLQKVPRSEENPWGLLVSDWEEELFKK